MLYIIHFMSVNTELRRERAAANAKRSKLQVCFLNTGCCHSASWYQYVRAVKPGRVRKNSLNLPLQRQPEASFRTNKADTRKADHLSDHIVQYAT